MSAEPIFVVGVGRSGTSLVQSILAGSPEVSFLPETSFLRRLVISGRLDGIYRRGGLDALVTELAMDRFLRRVDFDWKASIFNKALLQGEPVGLQAYRRLQEGQANRANTGRFGDKDPRLIEQIGYLREAFPGAYVVHVIRDPRDVLASKLKAEWARGRSALVHIAIGSLQYRLGKVGGRKLLAGTYVEVIYEALLRDPALETRKLCEAVGLTYSEKMLEFSSSAGLLVTEDEIPWKKETLGPLLKDNAGKWREVLSPFQARVAEIAFGPDFARLGYTAETVSRMGSIHRIWASLVGHLIAGLASALAYVRISRFGA